MDILYSSTSTTPGPRLARRALDKENGLASMQQQQQAKTGQKTERRRGLADISNQAANGITPGQSARKPKTGGTAVPAVTIAPLTITRRSMDDPDIATRHSLLPPPAYSNPDAENVLKYTVNPKAWLDVPSNPPSPKHVVLPPYEPPVDFHEDEDDIAASKLTWELDASMFV